MSRTKGWTLVWAIALALALWQFTLLSFFTPRPPSLELTASRWLYINAMAWAGRLLISAPMVALGIVVACLTRPQRPERRAAIIGALATLAVMLPSFFPGAISMRLHLSTLAMAGTSFSLVQLLPGLLLLSLGFGLSAALSTWVGANYWRRGNFTRFWKGAGGAILKGGIAAGMASVVLEIVEWHGPIDSALRSEALAIGLIHPEGMPVLQIVIHQLGRIGWYAVITSLFVSWRPGTLVGAFAGSGVSLGLYGIGTAFAAWLANKAGHPTPMTSLVSVTVFFTLFGTIVPAAIAGSFAGRWRDETAE